MADLTASVAASHRASHHTGASRVKHGLLFRSGGIRRDVSLNPIIERTRAALVALADADKYDPDQSRDDQGRWSDEGAGHVSTATLRAVQERAVAKWKKDPKPTAAERKKARETYARLGAARAEANARGSSTTRARNKELLLCEFGDCTHAPCIYCGAILDASTLQRDRIYPGSAGGHYRIGNLVPADAACNKARSDTAFPEFLHQRLVKVAKFESGQMCSATEMVGPDSEDPPRQLHGRLQIRHIAVLHYDRYSIDGVAVEPDSITVVKYSPDQERVPAGSPEGGEFAGGLSEARAAWYDYNTGAAIKEASRVGGDVGTTSDDGRAWTTDERAQIEANAKTLQAAAQSGTLDTRTVWRGQSLPIDNTPKYHDLITLDSLTAASPRQDIATIYADAQFTGGEPGFHNVLFEYFNGGGIVGTPGNEPEMEAILPRGSQYRVAGTYHLRQLPSGDEYEVIRLYSKETPAAVQRRASEKLLKYSEDEPRDERGRWTTDGGEGRTVDPRALEQLWNAMDAWRAKYPDLPPPPNVLNLPTSALAEMGLDKPQPTLGPGVGNGDPKVTMAALRQLDTLQEAFPGVPARVDIRDLAQFGPNEDATIALTIPGREGGDIYLHSKFWAAGGDTASLYYPTSGFHPLGTDNPEGYLTHEFGHIVDHYLLAATNTSPAANAYREWRAGFVASGRRETLYGGMFGAKENVAEVFSAAFSPDSRMKDDPYAKQMRDLLTEYKVYVPPEKIEKVAGSTAFLDQARQILRQSYIDAYEEGWEDSGEDPPPDDPDPELTDWLDSQGGFLATLAAMLIGGALTTAMINARMAAYAATANPIYERGFAAGVNRLTGAGVPGGPAVVVTWNAEGDQNTCELCDDRNGQTWDSTDDYPYPGEGNYGEICEGGPNCRCSLDYSVAPTEADLGSPDLGPPEAHPYVIEPGVADDPWTEEEPDLITPSAFPDPSGIDEADLEEVATADLTKLTVAELESIRSYLQKYDENEPRDERGRWTDGGAEFSVNEPGYEVEKLPGWHVTKFGKLPPGVAKPLSDAAARMAQAFPMISEKMPVFLTVGSQSDIPGDYMMTAHIPAGATESDSPDILRGDPLLGRDHAIMVVNERTMMDPDAILAVMSKDVANGWGVPGTGTDIGSNLVHEFGHVVDYYTGKGGTETIIKYATPDLKAGRNPVLISGYSNGSPAEAFAEAFRALFYTPKAQWTPDVKAVAKFVDRVKKGTFARKFDESESRDEAGRWTDGGADWTSAQQGVVRQWVQTFAGMRWLQKHPESEDGKLFAEALDRAPNYTGTLYRGLGRVAGQEFDAARHLDQAVAFWKDRIGGKITFDTPVSITNDPGVATSFGVATGQMFVFDSAPAGQAKDIERVFDATPVLTSSGQPTGMTLADFGRAEGVLRPGSYTVASVSSERLSPTGLPAEPGGPSQPFVLIHLKGG